MSNYKVVTVTNRIPNEWYYLQKEFFKSLGSTQPFVITGWGERWGGLTTKPKWLYRAIKENMIAEDIIIFPDNWDLVFAASCDEIVELFKAANRDVVISAEANCFPSDTRDAYDKLCFPKPYRYLNSGFIVGYKEAILRCLESMDLANVPNDYYDVEKGCNVHPNDQLLWQETFLKQPVNIGLDISQQFSQTLHDADINDFDFSEKRVRNKITETYPATWHFNGGSKDNLSLRNPILAALGLKELNVAI